MRHLTTTAALLGLNGSQAHLAWAVLVDRHGADIFRMICSRIRDKHNAEDAYQEFWIQLPQSAMRFTATGKDSERAARNWLLRIAYTTAIDFLRRSKAAQQRQEKPVDPVIADSIAAKIVERPGTEDLQEVASLQSRIQQVIDELPEGYRRPVLLHIVGGLSYDDLANELKCTVNNARVRVHRAIKQIRDQLDSSEKQQTQIDLRSLIVPLALTVPAAPALPTAIAVPIPVVGKMAMTTAKTSWMQSPLLGIGGAAVTGVAVVAAVSNYSPPTPPAPTIPPDVPIISVIPPPPPTTKFLIDDFQRQDPNIFLNYEDGDEPQPISIGYPDKNDLKNGAMVFSWPKQHGIWIDGTYRRPFIEKYSQIMGDQHVIATMRIKTEVPSEVIKHVGLRFTDANNVIYEFRQPIQSTTDWQTLTFTIDRESAHHWDTRPIADGPIKYPLSRRGYAIAFNRTLNVAGTMYIDDVWLSLHETE